MAFIISIVGSKGGIGKSTLSSHLCGKFTLEYYKTKLFDLDNPQHTSFAVKEKRVKSGLEPLFDVECSSIASIKSKLEKIYDEYDIVILDCGAGLTQELVFAAAYADLILMPIRPSEGELDTIFNVEAEMQKIPNFNTDCFIVPTRVIPPRNGFENERLSDMKNLKPLYFKFTESYLSRRESYDDSLSQGKSINEYYDKKGKLDFRAITELDRLFNELRNIIN